MANKTKIRVETADGLLCELLATNVPVMNAVVVIEMTIEEVKTRFVGIVTQEPLYYYGDGDDEYVQITVKKVNLI